MPRWYMARGRNNKDLRAIRYQWLRSRGYPVLIARRVRDWGCMRFHQAFTRFNPRIKDKPGEGALFWKGYRA